jgi:hypothetical protein
MDSGLAAATLSAIHCSSSTATRLISRPLISKAVAASPRTSPSRPVSVTGPSKERLGTLRARIGLAISAAAEPERDPVAQQPPTPSPADNVTDSGRCPVTARSAL